MQEIGAFGPFRLTYKKGVLMMSIEYTLSPSQREFVFHFPFEVKKAIKICKEVIERADQPFIWSTNTLDNHWLGLSGFELGEFREIEHTIHDILAAETGERNYWENARLTCNEDVEWGEWRNKDLTGKYYYKFTLLPEFAEKIRSVSQKWHDDLVQILEALTVAEQREREEREARRSSLKCEILKRTKVRGGDGIDLSAQVRLTDPKTNESLQFACRNVFDVGYVINAAYAVSDGLQPGGIPVSGKWQYFDDKKGWYDIRELTEFEKRCIEYLCEFPPVYDGIRL